MDMPERSEFPRISLLHLTVIFILGFVAYSNTFDVPFQWDDKFKFLKENPVVKDLSYFLDPAKANDLPQYEAFKGRYFGYLTFALNYKIHGLDVWGYHAVNLAIHILNSFLVYAFVLLAFSTPSFKNASFPDSSTKRLIALFVALFFVSHPIQTEAVTYIFQRLASLSAFFFLLSLVMYAAWRINYKGPLAYYLISIASAVIAVKTKENAFTLPVVIALYDFVFFKDSLKSRAIRLTPLLLTMLIIPISLGGPVASMSASADSAPTERLSGWQYLLTQFGVIADYVRLFVLPLNQNIYHDYSPAISFWSLNVIAPLLILLSLLGISFYLYARSDTSPAFRLISFGVFWFFITLSVESSIIPIPMLMNEYRVYLPSVGLITALTAGVFMLSGRLRLNRRALVAALSALVIILATAAYARNSLWRSEIRLWEDAVKKSPNLYKARNNLGMAYMSEGLTDKAIEQFRASVALNLDYEDAHFNLGIAYLEKGLFDEAKKEFSLALQINPNDAEARRFLDEASRRALSPH